MIMTALSSAALLTAQQLKPFWTFASVYTFPEKPKFEALLNTRLKQTLLLERHSLSVDAVLSLLQYIELSDHDSKEDVLKALCFLIDNNKIQNPETRAITSGCIFKVLNSLLALNCASSAFRLIDYTLDLVDNDYLIPYIFKSRSSYLFYTLHSNANRHSQADGLGAKGNYKIHGSPKSHLINERVYIVLSQKMKLFSSSKDKKNGLHFESLDLIIACICFSSEAKSSTKYRLFETMESCYLNSGMILKYDIRQLVKTMLVFASVGRFRDEMVQAIEDRAIKLSLEFPLTLEQKMLILYCNAKFGRKSHQNCKLATELLSEVKIRHMYYNKEFISIMSRTLWSMAVLQLLSIDQIEFVNNIFTIAKKKFPVESSQIRQLRQAAAEIGLHIEPTDNQLILEESELVPSSWTHQVLNDIHLNRLITCISSSAIFRKFLRSCRLMVSTIRMRYALSTGIMLTYWSLLET